MKKVGRVTRSLRNLWVIEMCLVSFFKKLTVSCFSLSNRPLLHLSYWIIWVSGDKILPVFPSVWQICRHPFTIAFGFLTEWLFLKYLSWVPFLEVQTALLHRKVLKIRRGLIVEMVKKTSSFGSTLILQKGTPHKTVLSQSWSLRLWLELFHKDLPGWGSSRESSRATGEKMSYLTDTLEGLCLSNSM